MSLFDGSRFGRVVRDPERNTVLLSDFRVGNTWFSALDASSGPGSPFNESVSFVVLCDDQEEVDRYWASLSAVPEAEACGWCKDRFGVSWQVVPSLLDRALRSGDPGLVDRLTRAFLSMKKLDVARLHAVLEA